MTTFDYIFVSTSIGVLVGLFIGWLSYRKRLSDLEFNNEMLLDFHEKLIRKGEDMERQLKASDEIVDAYCKLRYT